MVREALTAEMLSALEPHEVAARFIARRAEGLTQSEQRLLDEWLARDTAHRRLFENAERAWRAFDDTEGDEILAAMRTHALTPKPKLWMRVRTLAAAAVVVLAVGLALMLSWKPGRGVAAVGTFEYASARGEVQELQLPDGSTLTLDADSAAVGRFGTDVRSIELQRGRALFAIARDPARPFSVTVADTRVVAIGTRFDVNRLPGGFTVTLLEGGVRVEARDGGRAPVTLAPGDQYADRFGTAQIRKLGEARDNVTSWRTGLIHLDEQTLGEAAAVMNRYSVEQIEITDPAVAALRVSGQFRAGESQRFAETLAEMRGLEAVRDGARIELRKKISR
jgi:transmembrane sensor